MYANKIYQIILVICFIMGLISSGYGKGIYSTQTAEAKTGSGLQTKQVSKVVQETKTDSGSNRKSTKKECDSACKIKTLNDLGIRKELSYSIVVNCKALADDPVHCIKFLSSIVANESSKGFRCGSATGNKYNCTGMGGIAEYKSYNDGVVHWIGKYNKYWYKAKSMGFFYSPAGSLPPSRYCTSEKSSNSKVGCPNGLKNSTIFFNKLTF